MHLLIKYQPRRETFKSEMLQSKKKTYKILKLGKSR